MKWYLALPANILLSAVLTFLYAPPLYAILTGQSGVDPNPLFSALIFITGLIVVDYYLSRIFPEKTANSDETLPPADKGKL